MVADKKQICVLDFWDNIIRKHYEMYLIMNVENKYENP